MSFPDFEFSDSPRKAPCADPTCRREDVHPEHPKPVTTPHKPGLRTRMRELAMEWACDGAESLASEYHVRFCPGCHNAKRILTILEETK